jgi:hypothetical protein
MSIGSGFLPGTPMRMCHNSKAEVAAAFRLRNRLKSQIREAQAVGANGRSPLLAMGWFFLFFP